MKTEGKRRGESKGKEGKRRGEEEGKGKNGGERFLGVYVCCPILYFPLSI